MKSFKGSKLLNLVVALTVLVLFAATPVFADVVGKISYLNGRVDIMPQGQGVAVPLESGAPVSSKDIIRTKSGSKAEITFNDGTVVRLAPGTRVGITSYLFEENGLRKSGALDLYRGKIRSMNPRGAKGLDVMTPNAKASAQGTDFFFIYEKGSSWFYGTDGDLWALQRKEADKTLFDNILFLKTNSCVQVAAGIPLPNSCVFKNIDVQKHMWDTAINQEAAPVVAKLTDDEAGVYTYTPLGGRAIDTPSLPVPIAVPDLKCTQCAISIPPQRADIAEPQLEIPPVEIKMGDFERLDPCNPCDAPTPPPQNPGSPI